MELRYSELKYDGKIYTEQWKIDEILIKNKFNWMVNAEIKNARLEIFQDTLVWNAGVWYNGSWYFGVWRDGEWRYGTWQNGVWYNGVWRNGTFKSGIIYNGKFFKGKIDGGEIRGGQFIDCEISQNVKEYTSEEYKTKQVQAEKQEKQEVKQPVSVQPDPNKVVFHSSKPAVQPVSEPKIQQEKINYRMKKIKTFDSFITESDTHYTTIGKTKSLDELKKEYPKDSWIGIVYKNNNEILDIGQVVDIKIKDMSNVPDEFLSHVCSQEIVYKSEKGGIDTTCINFWNDPTFIKFKGKTKEDIETQIDAEKFNIF